MPTESLPEAPLKEDRIAAVPGSSAPRRHAEYRDAPYRYPVPATR